MPWIWEEKREQALTQLKQNLIEAPTLSFFNPEKETVIWVDASPVGVGAILLQRDSTSDMLKPVAYASRSLTLVERRYSQLEREAIGIMWGCKRFRLYVLGKSFEVITDHKPLESIFNNSTSRPSLRIERMILKLQEFHFKVTYKPGSKNISDYLSRHPVEEADSEHENDLENLEEYAVLALTEQIPKALSLEEISNEIRKDNVLNKILGNLENGKKLEKDLTWNESDAKFFEALNKVVQELSVVQGTLLKGKNVVIPRSLQKQVVQLAHRGHQGIVKTKKLLRTKVWFPKLDEAVQLAVGNCHICQTMEPEPLPNPLEMTELPERPWQNIAMDFCGPLNNGKYLLVVVDEFSPFPMVVTVTSTSAAATIPQVRKMFGLFGIPEVVKTDNGPPFSGHEFHSFLYSFGVKHRKCSPRWPQANGTVERLMKPLKKALQVANLKDTDFQLEIEEWLCNYRATPHCTTGVPPFTAMFGRVMKGSIPDMSDDHSVIKKNHFAEMRKTDQDNKKKMKEYADQRRGCQKHSLKNGNSVLLKRIGPRKQQSKFDPVPWIVTQVKGTMVTASRNGSSVTRNACYFKKFVDNRSSVGMQVRQNKKLWSDDMRQDDELERREDVPVFNDHDGDEDQQRRDQVPIFRNEEDGERGQARYVFNRLRRPPKRLIESC